MRSLHSNTALKSVGHANWRANTHPAVRSRAAATRPHLMSLPSFVNQRNVSTSSEDFQSERLKFPGALNSRYTSTLKFSNASETEVMPTFRVINSNGEPTNSDVGEPEISQSEATTLYKNMLLVSIMDLVMFEAQRQGRLSFYMMSAGEEGIAVGSASCLAPTDVVFAQYRETGVLQQRGFTMKEFMAQLFAHRGDVGRGRNMPVHYGSGRLNVHTISSPLATQIPQAAGAAYALKTRHRLDPARFPASIVACYFGEGAASEGDFHAALNIAATRSCPVVFICRNNGYAISTKTAEQYRGDGIAGRGCAYGIDTIRVDGNDIFAVRQSMQEARRRALAGIEQDGGKPILIEAMSYRASHHSTSDDSFAYRAKVEVEEWKRKDTPIVRLRKWLERRGWWDDDKERTTRSGLRKLVLQAFSEAELEQKPPIKYMFEDVYEQMTEESKEQKERLKALMERYPDEYDLKQYEGGISSLS